MTPRTLGTRFSVALAALALPVLLVVELEWNDGPVIRVLGSAHAIVGAPMTPVSVAGVARRTTYRVVAAETATVAAAGAAQQQAVAQQQAATAKQQQATAQQQAAIAQQQAAAQQNAGGAPAIGTVVPAIPSGCVTEPHGDVQYYRCGDVYYRAAFQSNNLVYVVQPKP
jgi:multidrug efflux pump subunit AcrA (membrane-fusion protein)